MRKHIITLLFCLFAVFTYSQRGHDFLQASLQQASGPVNIYNGLNAADPVNEVNGVANIDDIVGVAETSQASGTGVGSPNAVDGSYYVQLLHEGPASTSYIVDLQTTGISTGDQIRWTVHVLTNSSFCRSAKMFVNRGWNAEASESLTPSNGVWTQFILTATATQDNPELSFQFTSCGDAGMVIQFDNIILEKIN